MFKGPFNSASPLLIPESPLQFLPALGSLLGSDAALVLQQIQYWMNRSTNIIDGERWVYNSIDDWNMQFYWFDRRTLQRHLKELQDFHYEGKSYHIIKVRATSKTTSVKWYTINYAALNELYPFIVRKSIENRKKIANRSREKDKIYAQYPELAFPVDEAVAAVIGGRPDSLSASTDLRQVVATDSEMRQTDATAPDLRQDDVTSRQNDTIVATKSDHGENTSVDGTFLPKNPSDSPSLRQNDATLSMGLRQDDATSRQNDTIVATKSDYGENDSVDSTPESISEPVASAPWYQDVASLRQDVANLCQAVASLRQVVITSNIQQTTTQTTHQISPAPAHAKKATPPVAATENSGEREITVSEYVVKEFQKAVSRILGNAEKAKLQNLIETYGASEVIKNIPVVVQHEGRSVAYLETVLTNAIGQPSPSYVPSASTPDHIPERMTPYAGTDTQRRYPSEAAARQAAVFRELGF